MEQTLVFIKPDGVRRRLVGRITTRLEEKGLELRGLKCVLWGRSEAESFYQEHKEKSFFNELVEHVISGPMVAGVWEGEEAVATARQVIGDTAGTTPGTIRGDWAEGITENLVHGSDSPESARRELDFFFHPQEIVPRGRGPG